MINISDIDEHQDVAQGVHKKIISNETEYDSVEDSLSIHRTASNETNLVSAVPYIINDENVIIAAVQEKKTVSILSDEFCEEQAFLYLLPKGKCGYKAPLGIRISPTRYFKRRLLNFNQHFASHADYIFFASSVYEQYHLRSSTEPAMHKIRYTHSRNS